MQIGILEIRLKLYEVYSLKEKRQILKSLLQKLKNRFNVSVCESGYNDSLLWARIGIVTTSNEKRHVDSMLDHIIEFVDTEHRTEIIEIQREVIS